MIRHRIFMGVAILLAVVPTWIRALSVAAVLFAVPLHAAPIQWISGPGANGHHYELILPGNASGNFSWTAANAAATSTTFMGEAGHLVSVTSAAENEFLRANFQSSLSVRFQIGVPFVPGDGAWIGLTDVVTEGDYQWTTSEPFGYSNWSTGEPTSITTENYVSYWNVANNGILPAVFSWNDFPNTANTTLQGYIVEFDTPIPEPSTLALLWLGLLSLGMIRGRRRRR